MEVVSLHAEVNDAEALALRRAHRGVVQREVDVAVAQVADVANDPHRDVHRVAVVVLRAKLVPLARARAAGLTAGTGSPAAVGLEGHLDLAALQAPLRHGRRLTLDQTRQLQLDFAEIVYQQTSTIATTIIGNSQ